MESDDGPDYGHVSPTGEATSVLASVGEPQFENASGVGNRDDAGLRGSGEGEQDRSPEEVARDLLNSAEGLEPAYEYMSIEGSPDRLEACTLGGEPEDAVLDGQSCDETRGTYLPAGRESPLLNGVAPTGEGAPPLESRTPEGGRTQQGEDRHRPDSGLETMIRRLVAQNQMLQEELTSARLESRRTSSTESESRALYSTSDRQSRMSRGSEVFEFREGRGLRSARNLGTKATERGKGIGVKLYRGEHAGNEPETGSYRTFVPPWTQMSGWDDPHQLSIAEAEVGVERRRGCVNGPFSPAAVSPFSGQASGALGLPGQASGALGLPGQASGALGLPGQASGALGLPGQASINLGLPGQASGDLGLSGQASGASGLPGQASGTNGLPGQASGASGLPGQASGAGGLSNQASGASGLPGQGSGALGLPNQASGALGLSGQASGASGLPGQASGANGLPNQVSGASGLPGQASGALGLSGQVSGARGLLGQVSGALGLPGYASGAATLSDHTSGPGGVQDQNGTATTFQDRGSRAVGSVENESGILGSPSYELDSSRGAGMVRGLQGTSRKEQGGGSQVRHGQEATSQLWESPQGVEATKSSGCEHSVRPPGKPLASSPVATCAQCQGIQVQKVVVVIDGIPREGVIDAEGRVQVGHAGPEYFSIASEEGVSKPEDTASSHQVPPLPVFGGAQHAPPSPFSPSARSPFQKTRSQEVRENAAPGPSVWVPPRPAGPPPKTRSPSPVTPRRKQGGNKLHVSPATPGGTRIPPGTPPATPPRPSTERGREALSEDREFMPGDRTLWELPRLAPVGEAHAALRCADWVHKIQPLLHDLSPKAYLWWNRVMEEAREAYRLWLAATPLERLSIQGIPSEYLRAERFLRLESRGLAMLSKAVPQAVYDNALSIRNTTCVGILFLVLKAYQPGGLHERTELLKGLTALSESGTASQGVSTLQQWFRHLERARGMSIAIPDCTLLLHGIDAMAKPLLEKSPSLLFRLNATRMALQLDTVPTLDAVEQFARALLAELEVLAVSNPEGGAKRPRVAAVNPADQRDPKIGGKPASATPGIEPSKKGGGKARTPCNGWVTEAGCKFGKNCNFSHEAPRPQKCWVCGGGHQKADCQAPGGGKGPAPELKPKLKAQHAGQGLAKDKVKPEPKATPKGASDKAGGSGKGESETTAAIKEATKLLQSMRLARLGCHVKTAVQLSDLAQGARTKGLIDGGATACLRTAKRGELSLPTISVELACGKCELHVNRAGTLLSPNPVNPIVSVAALLELGYRVSWTKDSCVIAHPSKGPLRVDATSGCPEVPLEVAHRLIAEYEDHVKSRDNREARLRCILADMRHDSESRLAEAVCNGGLEGSAAIRLLVERLFSEVPSALWDEVIPSQCREDGTGGWNRRVRRQVERSGGVLVHLSDKKSKRKLQDAADKCGLTMLHVDVYGEGLTSRALSYLLELAQRGVVKGVVSSLPSRSFSNYHYVTECTAAERGEAPMRMPGRSIACYRDLMLSGPEAAARRVDDALFLRVLVLQTVALEVANYRGEDAPSVVFEQPECNGSGTSFWSTPEWRSFRDHFGVGEISFDQGPLLHCKRRPTTIGANVPPAACLVDCRGPGLSSLEDPALCKHG